MHLSTTRAARIAVAAFLLIGAGRAGAGEGPPKLSVPGPGASGGRFPTSRERAEARTPAGGSASWWLVGLVVAGSGAAWAGVGLSARRDARGNKGPAAALEVVGRVSVGPRQSVCLVRVNEQVLIVGTGPQGPPALLGELAEPARAGSGEAGR